MLFSWAASLVDVAVVVSGSLKLWLAQPTGPHLLAGSDPLPFAGDEVSTGRYAIRTNAFDPQRPVSSLRASLCAGNFSIVGNRDPLPRCVRRWVGNQRVRKATA